MIVFFTGPAGLPVPNAAAGTRQNYLHNMGQIYSVLSDSLAIEGLRALLPHGRADASHHTGVPPFGRQDSSQRADFPEFDLEVAPRVVAH
ncbi:hypothetical protein [Planomonospora algeriensis]